MAKETIVQARISEKLKEKFVAKLEQDGISQSDFIIGCIMKYVGILPEEIGRCEENTIK